MKTLLEKIQVMQAALDGKPIEWIDAHWSVAPKCNPVIWRPLPGAQVDGYNWDRYDFRVKPEPKIVPLEPSDIPAVCWIRNVGKCPSVFHVSSFDANEVILGAREANLYTYKELMNGFEYSTDLKAWKPCSK